MSLVIGILTFVLIITSLFLVLVVLMQRAKTDGGIGGAMGGGSMESTFGADTNNVLTGATIKAAIVFFVVTFVLYLAHIYQTKHRDAADNRLTRNLSGGPSETFTYGTTNNRLQSAAITGQPTRNFTTNAAGT